MSKVVQVLVFCLVLCLGTAAGQGLSFAFASNVSSSSVTSNGWQYRNVGLLAWDLAFWSGANYYSAEVTLAKGQAALDYISGACYVNAGFYPFHFIVHFDAEGDFSYQNYSTGWATSTNFAANAGYVGNALLRIEERRPNGTLVATQNLKFSPIFSGAQNGLRYRRTASSTDSDLKYITYTGDLPNGNNDLEVSVSYIASAVAGVLNQAETVVGPQNFESVIQIKNWPYASTANSLSLVMGVGMGAASLSGSGHTIVTKIRNTEVYFSSSKYAYVNGTKQDVKVSFGASTVAVANNTYFEQQLNAVYGANATYQQVTVTFPAGATNIVYDPSVGAGKPMMDAASGNSSFASKSAPLAFFFVIAVVFAALF